MSALMVDLPEKLQEKAREVAVARHLSLDALIAVSLAQTLSRLVVDPYLERRATQATGTGLRDFLDQVPDVPADEGDRW
jgi:hypothetical protein